MSGEKFSPEIVALGAAIYDYLSENHRGAENAVTYDRLNPVCTINGRQVSRREIRRACKAALRVSGKPVISCSKGIFVATEQEEIDSFVRDQVSRAGEMYANAAAAEKCSPARSVKSGFFAFAEEGK